MVDFIIFSFIVKVFSFSRISFSTSFAFWLLITILTVTFTTSAMFRTIAPSRSCSFEGDLSSWLFSLLRQFSPMLLKLATIFYSLRCFLIIVAQVFLILWGLRVIFERHCFYFVMLRVRRTLGWAIFHLLRKNYLSIDLKYVSVESTSEVLVTIICGHVFFTRLLEVQFKLLIF